MIQNRMPRTHKESNKSNYRSWKMSGGTTCSRLHRLINDSVRPCTDAEVVSLTKEKEKELLASLSQVLTQIQLWTRSDDDDFTAQSEDHRHLSNIIADLVFLLTLKSRFVQHLAVKILVVVSGFLATSGSNWGFYIRFLCLCMELVVNNALSFSSASSTAGLENSHFNSSRFLVVKPRLKNAGWSSLAEILRVLRSILKRLNQDFEDDDNLAAVYLDSVYYSLSNMPWDSLDVIYNSQNSFSVDALDPRTLDEESRVVFLGNLIQLFCSMVEQCGSVDDPGRPQDKHPFLCLITNLVPKLLYWCLSMQGQHVTTCIPQYFRHKLLVLMLRLSFQIHLDCCILVSWLQLLHNYFQELLWRPITSPRSVQNDCLEDSPFVLSNFDGEVYNICSRHLKRQAIFLFLRCCFSLINAREGAEKLCACLTADSCLIFDPDLDCIGKRKGLLELYTWLQGHLHLDMFVDYEMYIENCTNFSLSFLQLFVHEDDILFKVLLQLLSFPFCVEQKFDKRKWTSQDMKEDVLFHVSNVFNPVHLFHLFLAELHYDHQVLLDYLISKDTGTDCAEYLLRCLRSVSDTWPLFMEFSLGGKVTNQSSNKRRKMLLGSSNDPFGPPSTTVKSMPTLEEECKSDLEYSYQQYVTTESHYKKAKECLLSLKASVQNLHQKNLFQYNPEVLLKRGICLIRKNEWKYLSEQLGQMYWKSFPVHQTPCGEFVLIFQRYRFIEESFEQLMKHENEFVKVVQRWMDQSVSLRGLQAPYFGYSSILYIPLRGYLTRTELSSRGFKFYNLHGPERQTVHSSGGQLRTTSLIQAIYLTWLFLYASRAES